MAQKLKANCESWDVLQNDPMNEWTNHQNCFNLVSIYICLCEPKHKQKETTNQSQDWTRRLHLQKWQSLHRIKFTVHTIRSFRQIRTCFAHDGNVIDDTLYSGRAVSGRQKNTRCVAVFCQLWQLLLYLKCDIAYLREGPVSFFRLAGRALVCFV